MFQFLSPLLFWEQRLDKYLISIDSDITRHKSNIKDISVLVKNISEQSIVLADDFVIKTREKSEGILLKQLTKVLVGLLVLSLNFKIIKKIRKSKITKTLVKGFSFLENMV